MRRALELAERGWGRVSPNPMVGAVVRRATTRSSARAGTRAPGPPHAEVMALRAAGDRARGATVVCTLEPCDHFGRTPPCTRALIEAGVARVVVGGDRPQPRSSTAAASRELRAAGIEVDTGRARAPRRSALNVAFDRHVTTGRPFVVLKMASSLDGKTAARDGTSQWITGEAARADVQRLRAWADAIVVGAGDGARRRPLPHGARRLDAGTRGRRCGSSSTPPAGCRRRAGCSTASAPTLVATTDRAPETRVTRVGGRRRRRRGARSRRRRAASRSRSLVDELGKRDVQGVLIEGGATLAWSAVRDGVVDRVVRVPRAAARRWREGARRARGRRASPRSARRCGSARSTSRRSATT